MTISYEILTMASTSEFLTKLFRVDQPSRSTAVLETYMASFVMGSDAQQLKTGDAQSSKATMLRKLDDATRAPGYRDTDWTVYIL